MEPLTVDSEKLKEMRLFLESKWQERFVELGTQVPDSLDKGMCRFTALFVCETLNKDGGKFRVVGGTSRGEQGKFEFTKCESGYLQNNGKFAGHYWATNGEIIVDLACSQFGGPNVNVCPVKDSRYVDGYYAKDIKRHLSGIRTRVNSWAEEWNRIK